MGRIRLDLHVHSRHSPDSDLTVEALVTSVASRGLNGFALTDHNSVAGHAELAQWQAKLPELVLIPGVEVSTNEGHLLAFGVKEVPPPHRPVSQTIDWVRERGGVPVLAHPFRFPHGVGGRVAGVAPVPAIETINGKNSPRSNRRASEVAERRKIGATGGSDVHTLADLGRAFTEFPEGTVGLDGVLAALRAGTSTAAGQSQNLPARLRTDWRTVILRVRRGLRPI